VRLFLIAAGALLYAALYAVQPLLPAIERHFGAAPGAAGWGMTLPMLGLILGPWLDRPRSFYALGVWAALAAIAAALMPNLGLWALARFFLGAATGRITSAAFAALSSEEARRFVALNALGGTLGRTLGGVLGQALGPAGAQLALGLPLFALLAGLRGLTPPPRPGLRPALRPMLAGGALLFANLFLANLLPYRLEALGWSLAGIGAFYLAYLGGILGPFLPERAAVPALIAGSALLLAAPFWGFTLFLAGLFALHARLGHAFGQRGQAAAYVSGYYLGGALAGLVYPFFLAQTFALAAGLALSAALLAERLH